MASNEIAVEVLKVVLGSSVGTTAVKAFEKWVMEKRRSKAQQANLRAADIYDELHSLRTKTKSGRSMLLYTSNGGGIPDAGRPIYCSILYEVASDKLQPVRHDWQNQPIDDGYAQLLRELIMNKGWKGNPSDLKPGFLQNLYMAEGVTHAYVVPVYKTERMYYYLSLRWYSDDMPTQESIEISVKTAVGNITRFLGGNKSEIG